MSESLITVHGNAARARALRALRSGFGVAAFVATLSGCGLDTPPQGEAHNHGKDLVMGSALRGGGELGIDYDFRRAIALDCEEVLEVLLCTNEDPGFVPLEARTPVFFPIEEGTLVQLEITGIDEGISIIVRDTVLSRVGDLADLGSDEEELHLHPVWQVVGPPGGLASTYRLSFRLRSPSPAYQPSEEYTLILAPQV